MLPRGALLPSAGTPARAVRCGALTMGEDTLSCDVRKLPQSAVALDFKVPAPVSNEIHLKVLNKLAKQTRLTGFREGKAPPQAVIAKRLGVSRAYVNQLAKHKKTPSLKIVRNILLIANGSLTAEDLILEFTQ